MGLVLFGSPGSGKGTQAEMVSEYFKWKKISLGDILRKEVGQNSELGREVKAYMEKGILVPDNLVSLVIKKNLKENNFILDGYPRNLAQAVTLEEILKENSLSLDWFVYFYIEKEDAIKRLSKRRICKNCGANYHLENMPPKREGVCDECGGKLIQREDDKPDIIKKRWEVFKEESQKILSFYQQRGKLVEIDARGSKEEVFERLKKILDAKTVNS